MQLSDFPDSQRQSIEAMIATHGRFVVIVTEPDGHWVSAYHMADTYRKIRIATAPSRDILEKNLKGLFEFEGQDLLLG